MKAISADSRRRIASHIEALANSDPVTSARAEQKLFRFGAKVIPQLQAVADSPDPKVRFRVAWVLGKTRDPAAFETIRRLTEDPDPSVRYDAVLAMGELGDERAVPLLKALVSQPCDQHSISSSAKMALNRLKRSKTETGLTNTAADAKRRRG